MCVGVHVHMYTYTYTPSVLCHPVSFMCSYSHSLSRALTHSVTHSHSHTHLKSSFPSELSFSEGRVSPATLQSHVRSQCIIVPNLLSLPLRTSEVRGYPSGLPWGWASIPHKVVVSASGAGAIRISTDSALPGLPSETQRLFLPLYLPCHWGMLRIQFYSQA